MCAPSVKFFPWFFTLFGDEAARVATSSPGSMHKPSQRAQKCSEPGISNSVPGCGCWRRHRTISWQTSFLRFCHLQHSPIPLGAEVHPLQVEPGFVCDILNKWSMEQAASVRRDYTDTPWCVKTCLSVETCSNQCYWYDAYARLSETNRQQPLRKLLVGPVMFLRIPC